MYEEKEKPKLTIILAEPRGFCAGVERAIEIVRSALNKFGAPVYVRHEIVHNKKVLQDLRAQGAVFVEELSEVPNDRPVILSAHGVPKSVTMEAERRNMLYIDATCPLVHKVHSEALKQHSAGRHIIMIGHKGHPEVIGTMGQLPQGAVSLIEKAQDIASLQVTDSQNLAYITQTTLSLDDAEKIISVLKQNFPQIVEPDKKDICYATTNRQVAARSLAEQSDAVAVVGSKNSSNSNRLVEVVKANGCNNAFLVDSAGEINWQELKSIKTLGITAGASAPEILVQQIITAAEKYFTVEVTTLIVAEENIKFNIPSVLRE